MSIFDRAREWYNQEISIEFGITRGKGERLESVTWALDTTRWPITLERIEKHEQTREDHNQSHFWDSRHRDETSIRSDAKRAKRRS